MPRWPIWCNERQNAGEPPHTHNCINFNTPLCINLVDFKAAFDSIGRDIIWASMRHYGLPEKYVRIFQAFFNGTVSAVRVNGELTNWFNLNSGTGQGNMGIFKDLQSSTSA